MAQSGLFEGLEAQEAGIKRVAKANVSWLEEAHRFAIQHCARHGAVSAIDVRRWAEQSDFHPPTENGYSAVFRGSHWEHTGRYLRVTHAKGHAREIKEWCYRSTVHR